MFVYTLLWDLYQGFWAGAIAFGGNPVTLGYQFTIWQWIPAIYFISLTFWYLVHAQRRRPA